MTAAELRLAESVSEPTDPLAHAPQPIWIVAPAGYPISVRRFGAEGRQRPVVMLRGLESHSGWFVQSARRIATLGLPVHAFDRCGSGVSEANDDVGYRLDGLFAEIDAVAEQALRGTDHDRVHVVGHCFGAIVALSMRRCIGLRGRPAWRSPPPRFTR